MNSSISYISVQHEYSFLFTHSLNVKTLLFETIQSSISTQFKSQKQFFLKQFRKHFSSIWPIDKTLSGASTLGQRWAESYGLKEYSVFPKVPALLEPPHQIV